MEPSLLENFEHQNKISDRLLELTRAICEGKKDSKREFDRTDYICFGLAAKCMETFEGIQLLVLKSLIDDAFALARVLIEGAVNAAYVVAAGKNAADDYADYPAYHNYIEFEDVRAIAPEITKSTPPEEQERMKKEYEAVKHRYEKFRGNWCEDNTLIKRAAKVDQAHGSGFNMMRALVNVGWRKASPYVHGTAKSIASRVRVENGLVVIQRRYRAEEAAAVLYVSNFAMFALASVMDIRLGMAKKKEWHSLYGEWGGST